MKRKPVENEKLNTLSENLLSSLHHRDKSGRFSEKGVMELSEAERKLLLDWLEAETYEDYKGFHVSTNKIKAVYQEKVNTEIKKNLVNTTVQFVQQVYKDLDGDAKLQKALELLSK